MHRQLLMGLAAPRAKSLVGLGQEHERRTLQSSSERGARPTRLANGFARRGCSWHSGRRATRLVCYSLLATLAACSSGVSVAPPASDDEVSSLNADAPAVADDGTATADHDSEASTSDDVTSSPEAGMPDPADDDSTDEATLQNDDDSHDASLTDDVADDANPMDDPSEDDPDNTDDPSENDPDDPDNTDGADNTDDPSEDDADNTDGADNTDDPSEDDPDNTDDPSEDDPDNTDDSSADDNPADDSSAACPDCTTHNEAEPELDGFKQSEDPACDEYAVAKLTKFSVTPETRPPASRLLILVRDLLEGTRVGTLEVELAMGHSLPEWLSVSVSTVGHVALLIDEAFDGPGEAAADVWVKRGGDACPAVLVPFEIYYVE